MTENPPAEELLSCGHPVSAIIRKPYIAGVADVLYCGMCAYGEPEVHRNVDTSEEVKTNCNEVLCPACDGRGYIRHDMPEEPYWIEPCECCDGSGMIPELPAWPTHIDIKEA